MDMTKNKKGQMGGAAIGGIWTLIYIIILLVVGALVAAVLIKFLSSQAATFTNASSEYNLTVAAKDAAGTTFQSIVTVISIAVIVIIVGMLLGLLGSFGGGKRE
jgi:ABC-type Fe3+ transport system permease subunit